MMGDATITALIESMPSKVLLRPCEEGALGWAMRGQRPDPGMALSPEVAAACATPATARQLFIERNVLLVVNIATHRRYLESGIAPADRVQEGMIGLIRAVEKYDPARGHKFSTYATWWIKQAIERAIDEKSRTIRLPVHIQETLRGIGRARNSLLLSLGRQPTDAEIGAVLGQSAAWVREKCAAEPRVLSADVPLGDDTIATVLDTIPGTDTPPDATAMQREQREAVAQLLAALDGRARGMLIRRYGLDGQPPATLDAVGQTFGCTRERVRQILRDAIVSLRPAAAAAGMHTLLDGADALDAAHGRELGVVR